MTAPADLEAIKAMLVDALNAAHTNWWDEGTGYNDPVGEPLVKSDTERSGVVCLGQEERDFYAVYLDADKLAATVSEWFAARSEGQG